MPDDNTLMLGGLVGLVGVSALVAYSRQQVEEEPPDIIIIDGTKEIEEAKAKANVKDVIIKDDSKEVAIRERQRAILERVKTRDRGIQSLSWIGWCKMP